MTALGSGSLAPSPSPSAGTGYTLAVGANIGTGTLANLGGTTAVTVNTSGQIWPLTVQTS